MTGTQKHDLSKYIERKPREMYCTQLGVSYARNHTQYALYANTVMKGELLWSVHLHAVTQRHHMQHPSDTKCTICKLPITHTHAQAGCPLLFLRTWYLYVKLTHLLPALNPSWRTCLPTPWGTLIVTPVGHLVFTVNPITYMRIPHDLCAISLTGKVSCQSMHHAQRHGATHTMMVRVLGSLLTTWHKVQHVEGPPLLPVHRKYAVPRNPYGMTTHILTNPESLQGKWKPWTGGTILWPSPLLLFQVAHQYSLNASLPHIFLPSLDLSSVLHWYVTKFTGHWPETPVGVPSVAFVDTPKPIRLQGCITGIIYWSVKYGYLEHCRYLTCINQE